MTTIPVVLFIVGSAVVLVASAVIGAAIFLAVFNKAIEYAVGRGLNL